MRDWTGIDTSSLPPPTSPEFMPRTRRMLGDIDYFLRDLSRGIGRIQNGETPDGSGNPIGGGGTLTDYWFKPGISDPFTAFMSTGAGAGGIISSTAHDTKGKVFIGNSIAFDEANTRLGIGTTSPTATLHLDQPAAVVYARPISTSGSLGNWKGQDSGTTNLQDYVNETTANDATYISETGGSGSTSLNLFFWNNAGTPVSGSPSITMRFRIRRITDIGSPVGTEVFQFVLNSAGSPITTQTSGVGTASFADFTYTLTAGQVTSLTGAGSCTIDISTVGQGNTTTFYDVSYIAMEIGSAPSTNLMRWDTLSTLTGRITVDGYVESRRHQWLGTTSGTVTITGGTAPTSHTYILPTAQGAALSLLQNDGAGQLSWASGSSIVDVARTWTTLQTFKDTTFKLVDDGDATKTAVFSLGGASANADLTLAWAGTADRTVTLPNATGTIPTIENTVAVTGSWSFGNSGATYVLGVGGTGDIVDIGVLTSGSGFSGQGCRLTDGAGFFGEFQSNLSADRTWVFPNLSGTLVVDTNPTITGISVTSYAFENTASSGFSLADTGTLGKRLRFVLSGLNSANNSITLTASGTGARNWGLGGLAGNISVVGDDPPAVATGSLGKVDLTGQTAGIGSTNLSNTPPAGLYRVDIYAACTTVSGSGAPTLDVNIAWTDVVGATNSNAAAEDANVTAFPLSLAGTGRARASMFIQVASGNIAYTTTINAASGTPQYALYIRIEYLG